MFSNPFRKNTTQLSKEAETDDDLDLMEGESKVHETRQHWVLLISKMILPVLSTLAVGGLAFYRSIGGTFLFTDALAEPGLDLFNYILMFISALLLVLAAVIWVRGDKKHVRTRWILVSAAGFVALLAYYRYQGGRVFFIDSSIASMQVFDWINIILFVLTTGCLLWMVQAAYDWENDRLILTNRRVILHNDMIIIPRLIERRIVQQVAIEDIQDVAAATKTYPQHWLKYGVITVKSARVGGQLVMTSATDPKVMQGKIMGLVSNYRRQHSEQNFERMVEASVYGNKAPSGSRNIKISYSGGWRALRWLIPDNPEYNPDKGEVIWRPHWLFLAQGIAWPLIVFICGVFALTISAQLEWFSPAIFALLSVVLLVVSLLWCAWEVEDYRNDLYILTPGNVIDVQKKPFGPEDRRTAGLGNIQNVSLKTTFISNILGYGDVLLSTAGGGPSFTFTNVPNPRQVVQIINDYLGDFKRGEKERTLNDTLTLLRHYHNAQVKHNEIRSGEARP